MPTGGFNFRDFLATLGAVVLAAVAFTMFGPTSCGHPGPDRRMTSCASNLHGLFDAMVVYAGDHGGYLPHPGSFSNGGTTSTYLMVDSNGAITLPFVGALAKTHSLDNLGMLLCPGTVGSGDSDVAGCGMYDSSGRLMTAEQWLKSKRQTWGHYALRWGGWWHKVYAEPRLMVAEAAVNDRSPWPGEKMQAGSVYTRIEQHGGRWQGPPDDGRSAAGNRYSFDMNMNVALSDGSVVKLMNWTSKDAWPWTNEYRDPATGASYMPANDYSGDSWVTTDAKGVRSPNDRDGPYDFWTVFDNALTKGKRFPWGDGPAAPADWRN